MGQERIKQARQMARDERFITGIYNYCDRWCERCMNFAMEKEERSGDPGERDLGNSKFWQKLEGISKDTIQMIHEDAKAQGIDQDAVDPATEAPIEATRGRRLAAMEGPLVKRAIPYLKAVDAWMKKAGPLFKSEGVELATRARLGIGQPRTEAGQLNGVGRCHPVASDFHQCKAQPGGPGTSGGRPRDG